MRYQTCHPQLCELIKIMSWHQTFDFITVLVLCSLPVIHRLRIETKDSVTEWLR
jgi:hypothetical protein